MTAIRFEKTIDPSDPPIICDTLAFHTHLSKMRIKHAMRQGAVWIQRGRGKMCRIRGAKAQARQGDTVALYYDEVLLNRKPPQAHLVKDLFDYSVWSKPAGLMTQGTRFGDHCALTRQVEQYFKPMRRCFVVHRIDREAAGLVILAHTHKAAAGLSALIRNRRVTKHYRVRVRGDLGTLQKAGRIDRPLNNREALTEYRMLSYDPVENQSILSVQIHTGRRHQIRRHFEMIGFPVMGDPLYGSRNKNRQGMQLIAMALEFDCPLGHGHQKIQLDPDNIQ